MNWNPVDCHHEGLQKAHFSFCSPSHFIFTPYRLAVVMCSPSKWYSTLGRRLSHKTVEEKQEPLKIHIFFPNIFAYFQQFDVLLTDFATYDLSSSITVHCRLAVL